MAMALNFEVISHKLNVDSIRKEKVLHADKIPIITVTDT
jgi:hypothetical protein